jgi:[citrate (pro-3S)-lyase] ligase
MSDYQASKIYYSDKRSMQQLDALLKKEGIQRDKNLDYTVGLFDEDYNLVATGSCFHNTLRCLAVDSDYQGEGLLNKVMSHLIDFQFNRGNIDLFLYTKCDKAKFFGDLGFYEIAHVDGKVVFMENRKTGFSSYLNHLQNETNICGSSIGAVIMNANPFTLGHQYLLETASAQCDVVHVFVVSEDISLVPFKTRYDLIKKGSSHLNNIVYHETGNYIISNATFPSYFLKDSDTVIRSHAKLDIQVFIQIANALGITKRFVGTEPFSQVTGIYNQVMKAELEKAGIQCIIVPRKEGNNGAISASKVREMIHNDNWEELRNLVPESTFNYFISDEAKPVIEKIHMATELIHY